MILDNFPILATKRIVISKDQEFIPETTRTTYVNEEEVNYDSPYNRSVDTVEREVITTIPASSREFTKVKVEFLLKSTENTSLSRWFSETYKNNPEYSKYAEYLKVYFVVLDDSSKDLAVHLQAVDFRFRRYSNIRQLRALQRRPLRTVGTAITFAEILQNEKFTTTPVSDTSAYYQHDIYSEVEIDLTGLDLETTNKVHLIGFIQMDLEAYTQDNGLTLYPQEPYEIESVGGDLIYDLLLQRNEESLQVPFYRSTLYLDSAPYYGPAHYHSEDNPGPDDYVGWMAGFPSEDMGPKLDEISIRNYKVVSSIYDYQNDEAVFGLGSVFSDPPGSTGENLESFLNSIVDRDDLLDESKYIRELVIASSYAESKLKNNFIKLPDLSMAFINSVSSPDSDTGQITNEESDHSIVVGIDYFNLVRNKSNYGNILNFHHSKNNIDMVNRLLGGSKILNIDVLRDRVTNNAYSFNDTDSLDYKIYDQNEPSKKLVNTQDGISLPAPQPRDSTYAGYLITASTELATIKEIRLATVDPRSEITSLLKGHGRYFHIKDYDLFHNVQFGKYRYSLKITLIDGVYKAISKIYDLLLEAYYRATQYFKEASQPVVKNSQGIYMQGNYDYDVNDFHVSFRTKDYSDTVDAVLAAYSDAVEFLTGEPVQQETLTQIECAIEPLSTNLETIEHLCQILNKLTVALKNVLKVNGDMSNSEDFKKQGKVNVSAGGPGTKTRTIDVLVKCPDIVSALPQGTVVANYSNYQAEDEEGNDITPSLPNLGFQDYLDSMPLNGERLTNGMILPSSYSSLNFTPYRINQYEIQLRTAAAANTDNKVKSQIHLNTAPKIVSSYNSFNSLSQVQKNNQTIMVNIARSEDSVLSAYIEKPASDLAYNLFHNAGVVIDMVGMPLDLGSSPKGKNPTSNAKEKLKDAFENAEKEDCLELSEELKSALQNAANHGISRREIEDTVESNYTNLNNIIDVIGGTYENMLSLIGSLQNTALRLPSISTSTSIEEKKFLGESIEMNSEAINYGLQKSNLYLADAAELYVTAPGVPAVKFKPSDAQNWTMSKMPDETYLFVKAEPIKKQDAVVSVNNAHLLRI